MNIAYIITGLGIGGAERVTVDIANRISGLGNNVIIIYLTGENLHKPDINASVKTFALNMKKTPWSFIRAIFKSREILKSFSPNVVHGQMFHANIFARILKIFYKMPKLISTEHNIGNNFRMFVYRITDFLSDFNSNVSESATSCFIKQNNIREKEFVFLNVGRLTLQKDHENLLKAFSFLIKYELKAKLMIVGSGELLQELKEFACKEKIEDYVIFAGSQNNIKDYYSAADCFVLSSSLKTFLKQSH